MLLLVPRTHPPLPAGTEIITCSYCVIVCAWGVCTCTAGAGGFISHALRVLNSNLLLNKGAIGLFHFKLELHDAGGRLINQLVDRKKMFCDRYLTRS